MSTITVLAFDPGGTTGWARYQATKMVDPVTGKAEYYDVKWEYGTLSGDHHHELEQLIELSRTDVFHLVTESFEFRQGKQRAGIDLSSREYIGVMKRWAQANGQTLHQQTAALGKGFVNDAKLKAMGTWSKNKHSRDATRHLVFFLVNKLQMTHLVESWKTLS